MIEGHKQIHVLLVEDHHTLAETVIEFLEFHDMVIELASNVTLAKKLLSENPYHVAILDLNLPDGSGYDIADYMRKELGLATPIIMLTARDTLTDKLQGFEQGADDYLVKPVDLQELVARVQAQDKRAHGEVGKTKLEVQGLSFDLQSKQVAREGQSISMAPAQLTILSLLMRRSPNIVTKRELELELWGDETPESDALRSHIYTLRKLIDRPFEQKLIHTVPGVGVKLCA
ncbi:MAG: response regulator transcription factor [Pseudomonadota bacterium]|nr:response regulator transcription factor [Pseudomonadota bacterium]